MKTFTSAIFSVSFFMLATSFSGGPGENLRQFEPGEYGTSESITLTLKENQTFHYVNNLLPGGSVETTGNWHREKTPFTSVVFHLMRRFQPNGKLMQNTPA